MNVRIDDLEALRALRPLDIAAYLRSRGWKEIDPSDADPLSAWEKTIGGTTAEVLAPRNQGWQDYARRVRAVIATLGDVEQRSELAILRDISEVVIDVVRLRAVNGHAGEGTIPLVDGLQLVAAGRGLMLSAACSAIKPKRAYHSRKPAQATKYLEGLRLGQSEPGSYVLTVLSPVSPALASPQLEFPYAGGAPIPLEDEPYERRVTRTLGVALDHLQHAARRGAATGELKAFEDAIPLGISADLCEAIGLVRECVNVTSFEVSIGWAPSRPAPQSIPIRTSFTPDAMEVVREAGRVLRERSMVEDFELAGPVIDLSRPDEQLHGTAVVYGSVEGEPRKVSVELWGNDWNIANVALRDRLVLRCTGELHRTGKLFTLKRASQVEISND